MRIKELNSLIRKHVKVKPNNEFTDAKIIAESLGIVIKNSSECLSDLGEANYPLDENTAAVYSLHKQEHTIYYDENKERHNFAIAVMIIAQLAWYHLGETLPKELCRLGAAMILIPKDLLNDKKCSISDLSVKFGVPQLYIRQYRDFLKNNSARCLLNKVTNMIVGGVAA